MDSTKVVASVFIEAAEQLCSAVNSPKYYARYFFYKNKVTKS